MIQGVATLVCDLGNSSTKCTVMFGKDAKGNLRDRTFELPNVFAPIAEDYKVAADYSHETSTILSVDTKVGEQVIKGHYCNGELQRAEKPLATIKPSATAKKYELASTALSYRLALLYASKTVMNMQKAGSLDQLDLTWKVVTLLPPGDLESGQQEIVNLITDITSVDAVYPEVSVPITIESVNVLPEGYCAYVGVVYDRGKTFRKDYKYLIDETVIVFDIGAGTTDCLMIQNNKLVQNSKYTVPQGGNNVFQLVKKKLQLQGYDLSDDAVRTGVVSGSVKDGATSVDISQYVNDAKDEIAQKIISAFQDFLEFTDIKARSVGYALVCGGGSMKDSEAESIAPLSQKIVENFKTLSPNAKLIEIPKHYVTRDDENGDSYRVEEQISPRELNLIGASILAEIF